MGCTARNGHLKFSIRGNINSGLLLLARFLVLPLVYEKGSRKLQRAVVSLLPWKAMHDVRDMIDVVHNTSIDILQATKQSLNGKEGSERRPYGGKDIMSILGLDIYIVFSFLSN